MRSPSGSGTPCRHFAFGACGGMLSWCLVAEGAVYNGGGAMSMREQPVRVLGAIVFTDAVSFSARMAADEVRTFVLVKRDLDFIAQQAAAFGGRVVKNLGDGLLIHFTSAFDAVDCALRVQASFARHASEELAAGAEPLQHRVGIHLGDVILSDADVIGDGVNVAQRVLTQADPGGICLSQTVYDVVKGRLPVEAVPLGERLLKNIAEPVTLYQIMVGDGGLIEGDGPPVSAAAIAPVDQHLGKSLAVRRPSATRRRVTNAVAVALPVAGLGFILVPWRAKPAVTPVVSATSAPATRPQPSAPRFEVWSSDRKPVFVHMKDPQEELKETMARRINNTTEMKSALNEMFKYTLEYGTRVELAEPEVVRSVQLPQGTGLAPLAAMVKQRVKEDNVKVRVLEGAMKGKTVWIARESVRRVRVGEGER